MDLNVRTVGRRIGSLVTALGVLLVTVTAAAQEHHGAHEAAEAGGGGGVVGQLFALVVWVLILASMWKLFTKAGQPGWAAIVPIYNMIVLLKIAGKPWFWLFGLMIPLVNLVVVFLVYTSFAKAFGKGTGFAIGMIFLPFIFYPMLAFSDAKYTGAPAS